MCVPDSDGASEPKFQRKTVYLGHVLHENLQPAIFRRMKLPVQRALKKCTASKARERLLKHRCLKAPLFRDFKITPRARARVNKAAKMPGARLCGEHY